MKKFKFIILIALLPSCASLSDDCHINVILPGSNNNPAYCDLLFIGAVVALPITYPIRALTADETTK